MISSYNLFNVRGIYPLPKRKNDGFDDDSPVDFCRCPGYFQTKLCGFLLIGRGNAVDPVGYQHLLNDLL
jgi:hypothetical protein